MSDPAAQTPTQIAINYQYVRDLSFESPNTPQIFLMPATVMPAINLGVNVQTRPLAENAHEVLLLLKLEATQEAKTDAGTEKRTAFIVELAYGGVFTVPATLPEEQLKAFLLVEAPRLLFPFARAVVADAVRDGGFPPLLLNPIDFWGMYQKQQAQISAPAAGNA